MDFDNFHRMKAVCSHWLRPASRTTINCIYAYRRQQSKTSQYKYVHGDCRMRTLCWTHRCHWIHGKRSSLVVFHGHWKQVNIVLFTEKLCKITEQFMFCWLCLVPSRVGNDNGSFVWWCVLRRNRYRSGTQIPKGMNQWKPHLKRKMQKNNKNSSSFHDSRVPVV